MLKFLIVNHMKRRHDYVIMEEGKMQLSLSSQLVDSGKGELFDEWALPTVEARQYDMKYMIEWAQKHMTAFHSQTGFFLRNIGKKVALLNM